MLRTEVDGVPVFWAEAPGQLTGALIFRVGKADETLATAGLSHLVEHLALFPLGKRPYPHNGFVDDTRTVFHASGRPDEITEYFASVCESLSALPFDRLEQERRVLRAEAASNPTGHALWSLRFGPSGYGLTSFAELGLECLGPEQLDEWRRARFTSTNCAVWLTGEPPEALSLPLAEGRRISPPDPSPIPELSLPAYSAVDDSHVGMSFMVGRSTAINSGHRLFIERAQDHLRRDLGLTYGVLCSYWRLTADLAHLAVFADSTPGHAGAVRDGIFRVLDELAGDGPDAQSLARDKQLAERYSADPQWIPALLDAAASDELVGKETSSVERLLVELRDLTTADVAAAWSEAAETLLVTLPFGITVGGGRAAIYGSGWGQEPVAGEEFEMKIFDNSGEANSKVVIGDLGVSFVPESGQATTVLFKDCVLVAIEGDYGVTVMDRRAERVSVDFGAEDTRERILTAILDRADSRLVVRIDQDAIERAKHVRDLASSRLSGKERLRELNLLARYMFESERIQDLAHATWRGERGLLGLTDTRLLLVRAESGRMLVEVMRDQVLSADAKRGIRRGGLAVVIKEGEVELSAITPAERAKDFAAALAPG